MLCRNVQLISLLPCSSDTKYMVHFGKSLCLIHIHPAYSGLKVSPEIMKILRALLRALEGMMGYIGITVVP